jgi:hypothetical protein
MPVIPTTLLTSLIALIGWLLVLYVQRKNARRTATTKYRAALLEALSGLYPIPTDWPNNIDAHLRQIFPILQRAVAEFRPHVPWYSRRSYDRAWFVYRLGDGGREIDKQIYHQYMGFSSPGERTVDPKETFRANVSMLFRFARET